MIVQSVSLASNGVVKVPGYEHLVRFGYTKNRGVYRLVVTASGEWEGLIIRCFWHVPDGKDPASSLVVDGYVDVPASVTAQPGNGCITFEGSDGTKTVTSADLRYRVSSNSGTEDGTMPEPGTPSWQQLVDAVHTDATAAEQAKTDAQTAASEAATSAVSANQSAQEAAGSLRELKDGIAAGDFKGEQGPQGPSARSARRVSKALKAPQALRVPLAHRARQALVVSRGRRAIRANAARRVNRGRRVKKVTPARKALKVRLARQVQTAKMVHKSMIPPWEPTHGAASTSWIRSARRWRRPGTLCSATLLRGVNLAAR